MVQQIFHIFYRTVNKYEFIKPQYLFSFFYFMREVFANNIWYLFEYSSNLFMHKGQ